jgi:hypothetical protein
MLSPPGYPLLPTICQAGLFHGLSLQQRQATAQLAEALDFIESVGCAIGLQPVEQAFYLGEGVTACIG